MLEKIGKALIITSVLVSPVFCQSAISMMEGHGDDQEGRAAPAHPLPFRTLAEYRDSEFHKTMDPLVQRLSCSIENVEAWLRSENIASPGLELSAYSTLSSDQRQKFPTRLARIIDEDGSFAEDKEYSFENYTIGHPEGTEETLKQHIQRLFERAMKEDLE